MPDIPRETDPQYSEQKKKHKKYVLKTYNKQLKSNNHPD